MTCTPPGSVSWPGGGRGALSLSPLLEMSVYSLAGRRRGHPISVNKRAGRELQRPLSTDRPTARAPEQRHRLGGDVWDRIGPARDQTVRVGPDRTKLDQIRPV